MPAPAAATNVRATSARTPAAAPAARKPAPGPVVAVDGLRMYLMRSGAWIKLPDDMTAEQAAQLEAEGAAAEKRLGKGPAPEPVPDVKKPAKKEAVKEPRKQRRRRGAAERGKAAAKAAAAAAAEFLGAVGNSKVAQYLASKALPVLSRGLAALGRLKQNEQTHDDAGEKLKKSESAVVIPPSEGQSKSNAGQVETLDERPAPVVDEKKAKGTLQESLAENLPRNIEAADNFKRDKKAQHMGTDVLAVVQTDKNAVIGTFGAMTQTPPPTPPDATPLDLPPVEAAPRTPPMNLAQGVLTPFLEEHLDLTGYTKQADARLKEEGVTQEQLDMVDSGELAEANREKKGMELKAKNEPLVVQQAAKQEAVQVEIGLAQEEKLGRDAMHAKRRAGLNNTAQKQKGTKSALEKKRDEVAREINGRYEKVQASVTKKLDDLEKQSMKRFDDGNARAAKQFEDNVKLDLDAYKADRYSGWFGWARKAKDWLLGMDELPRVKQIFDVNRAAFVAAIDKLVEAIAAENKRVIQECKDELGDARKKIQEYADGLEPGLKDIGRKAAADMGDKLNDLDQFVGDREKELQAKLKDKQTEAIKAIDQKIEKMKEAMSGALAKLGRLLLWAAKKFFTWALEKFGFSLSTIDSIINKGTAVLKAIFTGPIAFVKNLIRAARDGFHSFAKSFLTHLKNAVFAWLTDSLEGVVLPDTWNLKGILSVALQLAGISWQHIRRRLVRLIPETAVDALQEGFALVKTLVSEGPMAAWEQIKDMAGEITKAFQDAVSNWIKWKIIEEAVKVIAAMFIPGAGIIRAIVAIYDTIVFFIRKAKEIMQMVGNFLGSIAEIAAGNIAAAAAALEEGLARGLKVVIAFLAKLARLDKVTHEIRKAISNIQSKTEPIIDKVAQWIVTMAKKAGKLAAGAAKKAAGNLIQWWKERRSFTVNGRTHTLYFQGEGEGARLYAQSSPGRPISEYLSDLPPAAKQNPEYKKARTLAEEMETKRPTGVDVEDHAAKKVENYNNLAPLLKKLWGDEDRPPSIVTFGPLHPNVGGTKMEAKILTRKHEPGTAPSESWDLWDDLNPLVGGAPYYVLGHLLNEKLGGKGRMFNLTPITKKANADHSAKAETKIKSWVAAGKVVYYKLEVTYGSVKDKGDEQRNLEQAGTTLSVAKTRRLAALKAERKLARKLSYDAYIQKYEGGAWKKDPNAERLPPDDIENKGSAGY
ncbi:MAG: hypothetical protein OEZ09_00345 [Betaproteobacteria bacterium]|nr:hypothetical protein [Betaproteobacteria bacterium]